MQASVSLLWHNNKQAAAHTHNLLLLEIAITTDCRLLQDGEVMHRRLKKMASLYIWGGCVTPI
jgi:hypothetical protein